MRWSSVEGGRPLKVLRRRRRRRGVQLIRGSTTHCLHSLGNRRGVKEKSALSLSPSSSVPACPRYRSIGHCFGSSRVHYEWRLSRSPRTPLATPADGPRPPPLPLNPIQSMSVGAARGGVPTSREGSGHRESFKSNLFLACLSPTSGCLSPECARARIGATAATRPSPFSTPRRGAGKKLNFISDPEVR